MVCTVKYYIDNSQKVGLASMKPDMHSLIETVPTSGNSSFLSCASFSAKFKKQGISDFPGVTTVSMTNIT